MQSKAATVDEYFLEVPEARLPAMTRLRELCRKTLVGYEETMRYGMPCYEKEGVPEIAFNSQKAYISFYGLKQGVVEPHRDRLPDCGKGCVRFSKPERIDFDLLKTLIVESLASEEKVC